MQLVGTGQSGRVQGQSSTATHPIDDSANIVPAPISSGMRWTLWLSLLALPFSYGTNLLLARLGPAALGTFAVLNVYIGLVFVFFFFGGCAVPMKFLPAMEASQRSSFIASYGLIVLASLVPWLVLATWRPHLLRFLFGDVGTPALQLHLLYLSPVCLAYLLMITSLKGILEMKWAQILDRSINIGQFTVLLIVLLLNRAWLKQRLPEVVWLSYIGLTFFVAAAAFYQLRAAGSLTGRPRFWLPPRFWAYTLLLQANSILGFLSARLDYILILNTAGLAVLGQYVAITAIAGIIPRISGFVVDSLLPSIANCLGNGDGPAASRVAETYLRLMLPAILTLAVVVSVFARPVLAIMGPQYREFADLLQLASLGAAIQSLSLFTNACFTATDRLNYSAFAVTMRMVAFTGFFCPLWKGMRLTGAVIAWVLGEAVYHAASLYLLPKCPCLKLRLARSYAGFIAASAVSALPAYFALQARYFTSAVLLGLVFLAFLTIARYTTTEVRGLVLLLTSVRMGSPPGGRKWKSAEVSASSIL